MVLTHTQQFVGNTEIEERAQKKKTTIEEVVSNISWVHTVRWNYLSQNTLFHAVYSCKARRLRVFAYRSYVSVSRYMR